MYIQVLDVNDNAPEFAEPYAPRVCENTANDLVSDCDLSVHKYYFLLVDVSGNSISEISWSN